MTRFRLFVGVLWVFSLLASYEARTSDASVVLAHDTTAISTDTTAISTSTPHGTIEIGPIIEIRPAAPERRFDVYGNEVDDAFGDYRSDDRGDVYERHSPDTAVLRLSSPSV